MAPVEGGRAEVAAGASEGENIKADFDWLVDVGEGGSLLAISRGDTAPLRIHEYILESGHERNEYINLQPRG